MARSPSLPLPPQVSILGLGANTGERSSGMMTELHSVSGPVCPVLGLEWDSGSALGCRGA